MTDAAGSVGKNAVPVTEDATENYIKPAADVSFTNMSPCQESFSTFGQGMQVCILEFQLGYKIYSGIYHPHKFKYTSLALLYA